MEKIKRVNHSLSSRIWIVIAIFLFAAATTGYTVWRLDRVEANLEAVNQFYVPVLKHFNLLNGKWSTYQRAYEQIVGFRKWGRTNTDRSLPKLNLRRMIEPSLIEIHYLLDRAQGKNDRLINGILFSQNQTEIRSQIRNWLNQLSSLADREPTDLAQISELVALKRFDEAAKIYSQARSEHTTLSQTLESLSREIENRITLLQFATEQELRRSGSIFLLLLLVCLVFSSIMLFKLRWWLNPVIELTKVAQDISLKGISAGIEFPRADRHMPNEISLLTREFSRMGMTVLERERTIHQQKSKLESLNTYLKEQNEILRKLGVLNERVLNNMTSGLLVINQEDIIEQFNERYCELFALNRHQVIGKHARDTLTAWPLEFVNEWLDSEENLEFRRITERASNRIFNVRVQQLPPQSGRLLLFEDVTEIVESEERLEHARKLVLAGDMSSQVAHEVRNPLNSMSIHLEMLEEDLEKLPELKRKIAPIRDQVLRLERITGRYLEVGGKTSLKVRKPVDVHNLLERSIEFLAGEIQAAHAQVQLELHANQFTVFGDADALSQVSFNLIRNSIEALREKPESFRKITISTQSDSQVLCIRIADNGSGINPKIEKRLFEPFVTDKPSGHGLGLSVSRQICIEHGGELRCLSKPDAGAAFEFSLPIYPVRTRREREKTDVTYPSS